ncbi:ankyrin repeat-containing domain protein [Tuber borchii]|uniref:protein S-acyltransferase n=1 Tax=Tuber borchii TaxID=42251 RepID=A0A2T6ZTI7_TUBBO|nr:ankyrin repeat-containing domain protein [Tuber borchii]
MPDLPDTLFYRTPLSWAAERGNEHIVKLLLAQNGVDPNTPCDQGRTPLLWAVNSRQESIVKLLLGDTKVDPNTPDDLHNRTPLFWAVENGHLGIIKLLLHKKKVNPNIPEYYTPLHWAAEHDDEDVNLPDTARTGFQAWPTDVVKLLIERKDVDHNSFDGEGQTPLVDVVISNHKNVVEQLLEAGEADANWGDKNGQTSLHWSAGLGNEGIVRLFLRLQNIDPNPSDISGKAPLSCAAANGLEGVVKIFLETKDVNLCFADDNGRTPLEWARLRRHKNVVNLLQECKGVILRPRDGISLTLPLDTVRGLGPDMRMRVPKDSDQAKTGNYNILTLATITVTNDNPLKQTIYPHRGIRTAAFADYVYERDSECTFTGRPLTYKFKPRISFNAVHIYPLKYEEHWRAKGCNAWITSPPADLSVGMMNSVQNGMCLTPAAHILFDTFQVSINPVDNYAIVCFTPDAENMRF